MSAGNLIKVGRQLVEQLIRLNDNMEKYHGLPAPKEQEDGSMRYTNTPHNLRRK